MREFEGVYEERVVPFVAGDGLGLNLVNVRGARPATRGPVLLVHGAGVRANIFRAPVERTIVDVLVEAGYDVWLENWRASIDLIPNEWTLDQAALHDHPQAVKKVIEETDTDRIKAIIHCQGSTSFTMSAIAGLIPQVDTILTNAVSLHTVVPWWSRVKLRWAVPLITALSPYLNPAWGRRAPDLFAKAVTAAVRATHHECRNTVCRMVSFVYGSGFPALWRHENLNDETHDTFIMTEFGHVPLSFFKQMGRCVRKGHLVRYDDLPRLPADYAAGEPLTDARFVFFAGKMNRCFLPESQIQSHAFFSRFRRNYHSLHILSGYSHLDIFMGRNAARDVFPQMVAELERGAGR
jgi:hypothetical protein